MDPLNYARNRVFDNIIVPERENYVDAMNPGVKNAILQQQASQRQQLKKQAAQQIVTNPEVKAKIIKNIPQVAKESGLKQKDIKQVKNLIKDDQKVVEAAEENQQVVDAPTDKKPSVANQFFNAFMNVTPELLGGAIGALFAGDEGFVEGAQQGRQVVSGIQEKEEAARKEQLAIQQEADRKAWELSKMEKQLGAEKGQQDAKLAWEKEKFGKEMRLQEDMLRAKKEGEAAAASEQLEGKAAVFRKEYNTLTQQLNTPAVASAFGKIQAAGTGEQTAPKDMSLIFAYMRLLDPTSTVREGEQAMAEQARSVPEGLLAAYNKAVSGIKLDPDQRKKYLAAAEDLLGSQLQSQKNIDDRYSELAAKSGVDPSSVVDPQYAKYVRYLELKRKQRE